MEEKLQEKWLTEEESKLIDIVRKVLWGEVTVSIKNGGIVLIRKVVETFVFDKTNNGGKK